MIVGAFMLKCKSQKGCSNSEKEVNPVRSRILCPKLRIFWGGDCHFIEESTGSFAFGKDVVARKIFREKALRVFQLEKRLGQ
jgi:hypothetical protein